MTSFLLLAALLPARFASALPPAASRAAEPAPSLFAELKLPIILSKDRIQSLLQRFVDVGYGHCFRHLGDERDFDHGHLLIEAKTGNPVAILYHTQELAEEAATSDFAYLDRQGRNWIEWLDGRVENARRYERSAYPHTATWDWFVGYRLPQLRVRHTILDTMLDPKLIGADLGPSMQWTFTRVDCGAPAADPRSNVIDVSVSGARVCLALGADGYQPLPKLAGLSVAEDPHHAAGL